MASPENITRFNRSCQKSVMWSRSVSAVRWHSWEVVLWTNATLSKQTVDERNPEIKSMATSVALPCGLECNAICYARKGLSKSLFYFLRLQWIPEELAISFNIREGKRPSSLPACWLWHKEAMTSLSWNEAVCSNTALSLQLCRKICQVSWQAWKRPVQKASMKRHPRSNNSRHTRWLLGFERKALEFLFSVHAANVLQCSEEVRPGNFCYCSEECTSFLYFRHQSKQLWSAWWWTGLDLADKQSKDSGKS